ncbi:MAG: SRPBCC family protein [Sphingobacteriales bacterium]|nr:MAG: SRPBCC family protein [Sphingobacteriales bacterium]
MVDILTEIIINKPVEIVAAYAANPDNAPEWYVNIKGVEWKTPKPLTSGTMVEFITHFLGRKLIYTYVVTEFAENEKLVMRTATGPFPMETTYTWTGIDQNSTRMTLRNRGNPTGFSKFFAPFMEIMMQKANRNDLKRIRTILESR